jgi:hypothetical protein
MPIFDSIGDLIGQTFLENIFTRGPVAIYEALTGKKRTTYTYKTERKQFIGFTSATKFILTWEKDIDHLKEKLNDGFDAENVRLSANNFQFIPLGNKTIIRPPESISFYMFHFLLQWFSAYKIQSVGIVETARASYTAYNDPNSEYIIGQTDSGQKFFISLTDDYSKRQFLRINKSIQTFDDFDIARLQSEIKHHG